MVKFLHMFKRSAAALNRGKAGFTLIEMVVTVAVMAILISITTPSIFEFMRQKDHQSEELAQTEIRKALQAYLADTGELPDSAATGTDAWYNKIASYTSLSANEIINDVWGRPRTYIMYINPDRKLFGNTINVYYVTLHSKGSNGKADNTYIDSTGHSVTISGLAIDGNNFKIPTDSAWWSYAGATSDDKVNAYSQLRAGGDDVMMRFTNYAEVLERYNATIDRLDHLTQSLETYARSGYASRVSQCSPPALQTGSCAPGVPEQTIYYPRAVPVTGTDDSTVQYDDNTIIVDNTKSDAVRRTAMTDLMNRLGLPAEYCCSALELGTDKKPKPFYYFSNPRARTSTGCDVRPVGSKAKLPARITTKNSGDSNSDRTCG